MRKFLLLLLLLWPSLAQAWTAPVGIPDPGFCVNETPPSTPASWPGSATAGYYYVDRTHGSATDTANTYGYPNQPRLTVPTTLAAGSYVEIHGSGYTTTGGFTWTLNGSSGSKVWVVGVGAPDYSSSGTNQEFQVRGDYYVIKGLKFTNLKRRIGNGSTNVGGTFVCYRDNEVTGFTYNGTSTITSTYSGPTGLGHDQVFYNESTHDNGPLINDYDQHGYGGFAYTYNVWIVDNTLARNTGDGVQINSSNGTCCTSDPTNDRIAHHVYVARNTFDTNYQNGFWTKDARDVIFSQNTSYGHACGVTSHVSCGQGPGVCGGMQYGPERVWFLYNICHDNYGGIRVASDSNLHGTQVYIIGNVIYDNTSGTNDPAPDGNDYACIALWDVDERYVIGNTCWHNEAGIHATTSATTVTHIVDNVVGNNINTADYDVLLQATPTSFTFSHNVLASNRLSVNHALETLAQYQARTSLCSNCTTSTPSFTNTATDDYTLQAGDSVARDTGTTSAVYATYLSTYGVSISYDAAGTGRPQNGTWDMGAYEFQAGGAASSKGRTLRRVGVR